MTHARASLFLYSCKPLVNIGLKILKSSKKNYIIQIVPMKPKSLGAFLFQGRFFLHRGQNLFFEMLFPMFQGDISSEVGFPVGKLVRLLACFESKKKTLTNSTQKHQIMQTKTYSYTKPCNERQRAPQEKIDPGQMGDCAI